jgi:hypothetical protein
MAGVMEQREMDRVRSLYLDFRDGGPFPRRGDAVSSGKTLYYVLSARQVKRRDPAAATRIQMKVIREQDMRAGLPERLVRSAARGHGQSLLFTFTWYKREKKRKTFEQLMRESTTANHARNLSTQHKAKHGALPE